MFCMTQRSIFIVSALVVSAVLLPGSRVVMAQTILSQTMLPPGASQFSPPPPSPPPPPRIEVPKVPQLDAPQSYNYKPAPRSSFSDRISRCLDDAAAAGLSPSRRAAYSRMCANQ
jgi:hypothetical protein